MNKLIVAVFENEKDALEGLNGLKELHDKGTITLYSSVIAVKDGLGIVTMKDMKGRGGSGTVKGMAIGSLVGLIGGPAGFGIGAFAGSMAGLLFDMNNAGVDADFIDDISDAMKPGSITLLAEIDEEDHSSVDMKMQEYHGLLFRRLRKEAENDQLVREIALNEAALKELEASLSDADDMQKPKMNDNIKQRKKKLKILYKRSVTKLTDATVEYHEKEAALNGQFKDESDHKKAKIIKKLAALKEDYQTRFSKLKAAAQSVEKII